MFHLPAKKKKNLILEIRTIDPAQPQFWFMNFLIYFGGILGTIKLHGT
jgi:hypothetical protein